MNTTGRGKLIEATKELLWETGYAATSPHDILTRSGVGQGSFYHHFAGKRELAAAALESSAEDLIGIGAEQLAGPKSGVTRLRAYLLGERDALRGCRLGRIAYDTAIHEASLRAPFFATLMRYAGLLPKHCGKCRRRASCPHPPSRRPSRRRRSRWCRAAIFSARVPGRCRDYADGGKRLSVASRSGGNGWQRMNKSTYLLWLVAVLVGAFIPVQALLTGRLAKKRRRSSPCLPNSLRRGILRNGWFRPDSSRVVPTA